MLKNITLSADAELIRQARERAILNRTTLNAEFRGWLKQYIRASQGKRAYQELMGSMQYASPGQSFSRNELNER